MRPQNKFQAETLSYSHKLPKLSADQISWAYKKLFKFYMYKTQHVAVCFECGHEWKEETFLGTKLIGSDCPRCGKHLVLNNRAIYSHGSKRMSTRIHRAEETAYFQVITTYNGFQVIRIFYITHYCKKGMAAEYHCGEAIQHWMNTKGKINVISVPVSSGMFQYSSNVNWYTGCSMECRNPDNGKFYPNSPVTLPGRKVIPIVRRNGYNGSLYNYHPISLFNYLITDPLFEMIIKTGQYHFLSDMDSKYSRDKIEARTAQINICNRNHYIVTKVNDWLDHIDLLEYFGLDTHSPKYICPKDFTKEHQRLIEKKNKFEAAMKRLDRSKKLKSAEKAYSKLREKFFDLDITDGEINVRVLPDVRSFFDEAQAMHHCVDSPTYYASANKLIMSARKGDERLATIELSLESMDVIQCRGACNKKPEEHDRIVELINNNIGEIKKVHSFKVRKKKKTAA